MKKPSLFDAYCFLWRTKTAMLKMSKCRAAPKYLFILSGAACGSTLLHELISQSPQVGIVTDRRARESKNLPLVRDLMKFDSSFYWKAQIPFDWQRIRKELHRYWDPRKPVLLDKAPAYFFQAATLAEVFKPAYFICLHRNPYSQIESYFRKSTMTKANCIAYAIDTMVHQKQYLETFENTFNLSYTALTERPEEVVSNLIAWLPELKEIPIKQQYAAHNLLHKKLKITNLDPQKIARLSERDIRLINRSLSDHTASLQFLGYKLL